MTQLTALGAGRQAPNHTVAPGTATAEQRAREDQLVRSHLPLVQYVVHEIAARLPRHILRDDLVSAGMAGLAQAARSFSSQRGVSFASFARARIRGAVLDDLRERDWASRSVRAKARAITATSDSLSHGLGHQPSMEEIARAMGTTAAEVATVQTDVHRALVLDLNALAPDGDVYEIVVMGLPGTEEALLEKERRAYLVAAIYSLPPRMRRAVLGYYVEELPMAVLAEELGVTDSRISQICAEALRLLRDAINAQLDPDLVPADPSPRVAKRHDDYYAAVSTFHQFADRFEAEAGHLPRAESQLAVG